MRRYGFVVVLLVIAVGAFAGVASKDGATVPDRPAPPGAVSQVRADFEYNTAGVIDAVPTTGGSATGWASYFIVMVHNTLPQDIKLVELGFPCGGPSSSWGVWLGAAQPPTYTSPDFSGAFTPTDTNPGTFPPTTYSYVDVSASNVVIPGNGDFWFGYENPGIAGQVGASSPITYGWYGGAWDPDSGYGRVTVMQVKGNINVPVELQGLSAE
jgi:hypothetical protein